MSTLRTEDHKYIFEWITWLLSQNDNEGSAISDISIDRWSNLLDEMNAHFNHLPIENHLFSNPLSPSQLAQDPLFGIFLGLPLAHMHHDAVRHHRRQLGLSVIIDKFPFWIEDVEDNCVVHNVIFVLINRPWNNMEGNENASFYCWWWED